MEVSIDNRIRAHSDPFPDNGPSKYHCTYHCGQHSETASRTPNIGEVNLHLSLGTFCLKSNGFTAPLDFSRVEVSIDNRIRAHSDPFPDNGPSKYHCTYHCGQHSETASRTPNIGEVNLHLSLVTFCLKSNGFTAPLDLSHIHTHSVHT